MLHRPGLALLVTGIAAGSKLAGAGESGGGATVSNEAELRAAFAPTRRSTFKPTSC
jgi:hypothetical protein